MPRLIHSFYRNTKSSRRAKVRAEMKGHILVTGLAPEKWNGHSLSFVWTDHLLS
jgi:hypothetical protein